MVVQQQKPGRMWAGGAVLLRRCIYQPASPWPPVCTFGPLILASIAWNLANGTTPPWMWAVLPVAGYLLWTLVEYLLHSEIFHHPALPRYLRGLAEGHISHHDDPTNPNLIVARLSFSVPVAVVLYLLITLALQSARLASLVAAGLMLGYLSYEVVHFLIHRSPRARRLLKPLASHHLHHHYADPSRCFGVSIPLWDWIFRTTRRRAALAAEQPAAQTP